MTAWTDTQRRRRGLTRRRPLLRPQCYPWAGWALSGARAIPGRSGGERSHGRARAPTPVRRRLRLAPATQQPWAEAEAEAAAAAMTMRLMAVDLGVGLTRI